LLNKLNIEESDIKYLMDEDGNVDISKVINAYIDADNNYIDIGDDDEKEEVEFNTDELDYYLGYSYSDNTNDNKKGVGFLGEHLRFSSNPGKPEVKNQVSMWNSGWHLSSFLPNINYFMNKLKSYSHFSEYNKMSNEKKKKTMLDRIHQNRYIFGKSEPMPTIDVKLPETLDEKYPGVYNYYLWKTIYDEYEKYGKSSTFRNLLRLVRHELPSQVWQNPICYSYMLDRDFGFTKKLWWEVIPKKEWETIDFNKLNSTILNLIEPFRNINNKRYIKDKY